VSSSVALQHDDTSSTAFADTVSASQQQRRVVRAAVDRLMTPPLTLESELAQ